MQNETIAFTRGVPPSESFPREALITCAERVIHADGTRILQYGNGAGYHPLRDHIAGQYTVDASRVLIGQGSLQLLDHLCRVMLKGGDRVFIEQPSYDRTITLFKRAGADLVGFHFKDSQIDILQLLRTVPIANCVTRVTRSHLCLTLRLTGLSTCLPSASSSAPVCAPDS